MIEVVAIAGSIALVAVLNWWENRKHRRHNSDGWICKDTEDGWSCWKKRSDD